MEILNNNGFDFSDEELLTFLADIEDEDQQIIDTELDTAETLSEILEDEKPKIYNSDKAVDYATKRKEKVRVIQDMAFSQKVITLTDYISKEHAQLIIQALCSKFDELIERYEAYIIRRCNALLMARIPRALRYAYKSYPQAFIKNPGFIYVVPTFDDEKPKFFYVPLNIPYYFEQGTETEVIEGMGLKYSMPINNAISKIDSYKYKKLEAEAIYALKIAKLPRGSYAELLKAYPLWFDLLIKTITTQ